MASSRSFSSGSASRAGIVPLHVWLPEAHPAAPQHLRADVGRAHQDRYLRDRAGLCVWARCASAVLGVIVLVVGGLSAVLGVLYALMQHDLKRLLAYHSIENIGIILLGLGAGMIGLAYGRADVATVGLAASLYHVLNHAVFKGLLFLGAGGVFMATGTRQIEQLGGLLRRMPWTAVFFLVGAMAISGLPPLNGFASEWLTFQAFLFGFRGSGEPLVHLLFPIGGALLALTTALAAACFVKAFGMTFVALPRSPVAEAARESSLVMLAPQARGSPRAASGSACFRDSCFGYRGRDGVIARFATADGSRAGWTGNGVRAGLIRPCDPRRPRHRSCSAAWALRSLSDGPPRRCTARLHMGVRRSVDGAGRSTRPRPSRSRS